jgi:hypothetical protein
VSEIEQDRDYRNGILAMSDARNLSAMSKMEQTPDFASAILS